jgi:hypothetical protein
MKRRKRQKEKNVEKEEVKRKECEEGRDKKKRTWRRKRERENNAEKEERKTKVRREGREKEKRM